VRQKLAGFDLRDCSVDDLGVQLTLFVRYRSREVLNFWHALPDEDNESDIANSGHPGIADELRIKPKDTQRLLGVSPSSRFPVDDRFPPV